MKLEFNKNAENNKQKWIAKLAAFADAENLTSFSDESIEKTYGQCVSPMCITYAKQWKTEIQALLKQQAALR
jgi:hypothetical protein